MIKDKEGNDIHIDVNGNLILAPVQNQYEWMLDRIKLLDNLLRQGLQSGCFAGELKDKVNAAIAAKSG